VAANSSASVTESATIICMVLRCITGAPHKNVLFPLTLLRVSGSFAKSESDIPRITNLNYGSPFHFTLGFETSPRSFVSTQYSITRFIAFMWASDAPVVMNLDSSRMALYISGPDHLIIWSSLPTPIEYFVCSLPPNYVPSLHFISTLPCSAGVNTCLDLFRSNSSS
jgi:hypothetical protein